MGKSNGFKNAPSTTGNKSGDGRGNNPSNKSDGNTNSSSGNKADSNK
ncbi:MAG: hypothetical protein ACSHXF_04745 [Aquaticitalea sp.]